MTLYDLRLQLKNNTSDKERFRKPCLESSGTSDWVFIVKTSNQPKTVDLSNKVGYARIYYSIISFTLLNTIPKLFKVPLQSNNVFLLVPTVKCLSLTVQSDVCAESDTVRLFSH